MIFPDSLEILSKAMYVLSGKSTCMDEDFDFIGPLGRLAQEYQALRKEKYERESQLEELFRILAGLSPNPTIWDDMVLSQFSTHITDSNDIDFESILLTVIALIKNGM
jgi:hypothetical protein